MDRLLAKKGIDGEIDFEVDPKEQQLLAYFELMKKRSIFSRDAVSDAPVSITDLFLVTERLEELRNEQLTMH